MIKNWDLLVIGEISLMGSSHSENDAMTTWEKLGKGSARTNILWLPMLRALV